MSSNCSLHEENCCTQDFDCVGNFICIRGAKWTSKKDFCECSLWYGWVGENCLEFGPTSFFLLAAIVVALILLSIILLVSLLSLYKHFKLRDVDNFKGVMTLTVSEHKVSTLLLLVIGSYFLFQWRVVELINLVTPSDHTVQEATGTALPKLLLALITVA